MKKVLLAIAAAVILLILFLPSMASTSWGKNILVSQVNQRIPGSITIEELSLSWLGPQAITGLLLRDLEGKPAARFNRFSTDASLFSLLQKKFLRGNIEVSELSMDIKQESHQPSNLQAALGRIPSTEALKNTLPLSLLITHVNARIDQPTPDQFLLGKISGETMENGKKGSFSCVVQSNGHDFVKDQASYSVKADASDFPSSLLDQCLLLQNPNAEPLFNALLGPSVDFSVKHNANSRDSGISLLAKSTNIHLDLTAQIVDERFSLLKSGTIDLDISPAVFDRVLAWSHQSNLLRLEKPMKASIQLDKLSFPIQIDPFPFSETLVDAHVNIASVAFTPWFEKWSFSQSLGFENVLIDLETSPESSVISFKSQGSFKKNEQSIPFSFESSIPKPRKIDDFLKTLRERLKFGFTFHRVPMSQIDELLGSSPSFQRLIGPMGDFDLEVSSSDKQYTINLMIASDKLQAPIRLLIQNDWQLESLDSLFVTGVIEIDSLLLKNNGSQSSQIHFKIPWEIDGAQNRIGATLTATTPGSDGSLHGNLLVTDWHTDTHFQNKNWKGTFDLGSDKFPTQILASFTDHASLPALLGQHVGIDLSAKLTPGLEQKGHCSFNLSTVNLSGNATFGWNQNALTGVSGNPLRIALTLTPEGFYSLRSLIIQGQNAAGSLELLKPADLVFTSSSVPFSFFDRSANMSATNQQREFDLSFSISSLELNDRSLDQVFDFMDVNGNISSKDFLESMAFSLSSHHRTKQKSEGNFALQGIVKPVYLKSGKPDYLNGAITVNATANNVPAGLLCNALTVNPSLGQKIDAVVGETLDGKMDLSLERKSGLINLEWQSPRSSLTLVAKLNKGVLYLHKPLHVELDITSQLSRYVLQPYAPLFAGAIRSDEKMKLTIDPEGFSLNLHPLSIRSLQVSRASLQLGKIYFLNEGKIAKAVEMLNPPHAKLISFWFTPLYFSYDKGSLGISRLDMLVMDLYPLATWGTVNFLNDRMDMTIGLTGEAIEKAFKIPVVEPNYMLQLPLRGSIARAKIDRTKLTARLAALFASVAAGPEGLLLGTVAGLASSITEDAPPAPTTHPLPWSTGQNRQESTSQVDRHTESTPREHSSLKRIEKKADSFIRNFLKP